jgi:protein phosphatase
MFIVAALIALAVLGGIGAGYRIIRNSYYISATDGTVAIMRGIQGSILRIPLQEPYLLGCLNRAGELSQISYGQSHSELGCELMKVQDLRPSERTQVSAGLPTGSLDNAIGQLRELARGSLLPVCDPRAASRPSSTAAPRGGSSAPATSPAPTPQSTSATSAPPPPPAAPPQKPGTDCRMAA